MCVDDAVRCVDPGAFLETVGLELIGQVNAAVIAAQLQRAAPASSAGTTAADLDDLRDRDHGAAAPEPQPAAAAPSGPAGTLIIDATCAPADITYPTHHKLVNHMHEITEQVIDTLHAPLCGHEAKSRTYQRTAGRQFLNAAKANSCPSQQITRQLRIAR